MCLQLGALQSCKWLVCRAHCLLGSPRTCLQSPCSCFVSHSSQGRSKGQPAAAESEAGWGQDAAGGSYIRVERNHHWEPFPFPLPPKKKHCPSYEKQKNDFCLCTVAPIVAFPVTFLLPQQSPGHITEHNWNNGFTRDHLRPDSHPTPAL